MKRQHFLALLMACSLGLSYAADTSHPPQVRMTTSMGTFVVELYPSKAPVTVENFLHYVNDHHYDGTIFHRVIDGFMIQGGGFTPKLDQKPTRPAIVLENKSGLKNEAYTIAMARTAVPNSATAQFFINVTNNPNLDPPMPDGYGYAVFGKVISGTNVIDKIKSVKTTRSGGMADVPVEPVIIQSVTLLTQ